MKYSAISLFTGAGGMDYGVEAAGIETAVAVEMDGWCCRTLRHNRPNWNVIEQVIEEVSSSELLKGAGLKKKEADLLIGGPPCQPFSKSGYWVNGDAARLKDPRANTLREYMRVLEDTLPRAFILENVFGLAYKGKDEGLQFLKESLIEINRRKRTNYSFTWKVLNAADFGVPQIRERVFIVGSRDGKEFRFPEPRFFNQIRAGANDPSLELFGEEERIPYRTTWDALHDLESDDEKAVPSRVGGRWGVLLPSIPEGQNYLYHSERGDGVPIFKWRSRYWSFLLKLAKRLPSWTIQAQPGSAIGPFHWKNRRLTMREMARLQTFPDDIEILGGVSEVQKQIGNAVPSAIGEMLGQEIRRQLFGDKVKGRQKLVPDRAPIAPVEEKVHPVPAEFEKMRVKPSSRASRDEVPRTNAESR
ncbi:MAG: DNA cytosine methyltransferase [Bdellovibrionota bacterium]